MYFYLNYTDHELKFSGSHADLLKSIESSWSVTCLNMFDYLESTCFPLYAHFYGYFPRCSALSWYDCFYIILLFISLFQNLNDIVHICNFYIGSNLWIFMWSCQIKHLNLWILTIPRQIGWKWTEITFFVKNGQFW